MTACSWPHTAPPLPARCPTTARTEISFENDITELPNKETLSKTILEARKCQSEPY